MGDPKAPPGPAVAAPEPATAPPAGPSPTAPSPADVAPPPDPGAAPKPEVPPVADPPPSPAGAGTLELEPALRASLQKRASGAERLEARRLNGEGLRLHRKRQWDEAVARYTDALAADPHAEKPRFNLACALALLGRTDASLQHLLVHRELGHKRMLAAARVDPDFRGLRDDPRFRKVTGYARVLVLRSNDVDSGAVDQAVDAVRRTARYDAVASPRAAPRVRATTVLYRAGYKSQAREIAALFGEAPTRASTWLTDADVAVVLSDDGAVQDADSRGLEAFLDVRLTGKAHGNAYELRLKTSGFFTQRIYRVGGNETTKRDGRWRAEGAGVVLAYREIRETPTSVSAPRDRTERVRLKVRAQSLVVDGVVYRR